MPFEAIILQGLFFNDKGKTYANNIFNDVFTQKLTIMVYSIGRFRTALFDVCNRLCVIRFGYITQLKCLS